MLQEITGPEEITVLADSSNKQKILLGFFGDLRLPTSSLKTMVTRIRVVTIDIKWS